MKCVGGPLDGREYPVEPDWNYVQIPELTSLPPMTFPPPPEMEPATIKTHTYTVRRIWSKRPPPKHLRQSDIQLCEPEYDEIYFLAPVDWSDFKAIEHQFTK